MARTPTLPPTDRGMWRRLLARAHPDAGGDHGLFVWAAAVRDAVCGPGPHAAASPEPTPTHPSRRRGASTDEKPRVPWGAGDDFGEVTRTALEMAASLGSGHHYGGILSLLADCRPLEHLAHEQERGAYYKRLAAIGHLWGMSKAERVGWYRVAEGLPLSDRHAGHILSRLKGRRGAA